MEIAQEPMEVFLTAVNAHDTDALGGSLAPDFTFEEVAGPGQPSKQALTAELAILYSAFPDLHFRIVRISEDEGRRFLEFRAIGTHEGEFMGIAPTRAFTIASGVFNLEADEEFIHRLRLTLDFGGLRRQLLIAKQSEAVG